MRVIYKSACDLNHLAPPAGHIYITLLKKISLYKINESLVLIQTAFVLQTGVCFIYLNGKHLCTWCDVQLVANGEAPHSSSDAGRKPLPPKLPDAPRCLPAPRHTQVCNESHQNHS